MSSTDRRRLRLRQSPSNSAAFPLLSGHASIDGQTRFQIPFKMQRNTTREANARVIIPMTPIMAFLFRDLDWRLAGNGPLRGSLLYMDEGFLEL